ncbi:CMGC/CDK/CRK7 protein kinase [Podila verticillata NRRL 6337]|nr:CMGC/CDK/CRK7 protein kinase [Podila verticillata NRRL 6337]
MDNIMVQAPDEVVNSIVEEQVPEATSKPETPSTAVSIGTTSVTDAPTALPTTKATITASFTVPAVAKPLPTPALPFQSARASESLYTSGYQSTSSFGRASARSGAAAAASAAALQLQRELDLQHEILGRKPQLAQDIVTKEPTIQPTFRDYGATRDWRREQSRDRRDRSKERDYDRESDRYSRGRYDRSREREGDRHRDRYSRERSHERERDPERDRDYRHERGYRSDYRHHAEHSGDRDYRRPFKYDRHDRHDRHERYDRRDRYYREGKEYDSRSSHRDYEYDESRSRSTRPEGQEAERERTVSGSGGPWREGDDDNDSRGSKTNDFIHHEHHRGRSIDRHSRHGPPGPDHPHDHQRRPSMEYHRDHRRRSSAEMGYPAGEHHDGPHYRHSEASRTPDSASHIPPPTQPASHAAYPPTQPSHSTGHTAAHPGPPLPPPPPPPPPPPVHLLAHTTGHPIPPPGHPAHSISHPPTQPAAHHSHLPHQTYSAHAALPAHPTAHHGVHPGHPAMDPMASHQYAYPMPLSSSLQVKSEDLYERVGQVGEGTYGKVYKARNKQTGEYVALKRIRMETEKDGFPITAMREIKLLQTLNHGHVVSLKELMVSKGAVYMVFEYMDHDLTGILGHPNLKFRPEHVKCLMRQLLEGLKFLHHKGVLHRDIKGSNLLVNKLGELKLADFGLARLFQKKTKRDYTNRVITLWYRPPELLLGATAYGPAVDMWSAGCIMVELFTRKPIFQGHNEIMQLDNIWKTMGTPRKETWPDVEQLPWYELIKHLNSESRTSKFREMFEKYMSPAALDLAEALLSLDPKRRPTAAEALSKFDYFTNEQPAACLPAELPKIEGDWHEYESKQRKKAGTKIKQQHPQTHPPPPLHSQHNPQHSQQHGQHQQPSMSKEDQIEDDRPAAIRPTLSKKHSLSGAIKPSSAPSPAPSTDLGLAGIIDTDTIMTETDPAPKRGPILPETFVPPPNVSPSYLPHAALPTHPVPRPTAEVAPGVIHGTSQSQLPPPPPPPLPPPPPPLPPVMPTYAHAVIDPLTKQPRSAPRMSDSSMVVDPAAVDPLQSRFQDHNGAIHGFDQSRQAAAQGVTPHMPSDSQRHAMGSEDQQEHDSQSIPIPTGPAGYTNSKGYHDGHEHDGHFGYYGRSRHYSDYGRDRERDRDRDRDRYRDYGRRREDYRGRDWSRERERDRGPGAGGRDRERGGREYDWYRDHAGRERDRTSGRDRNFDDDEYYYRQRRDRERDYERDFDRRDPRDRDREREGDRRDRDREKDEEPQEPDRGREHGPERDRGQDLDGEHDRDLSSRERGYNRDRDYGGFKDLDDDFERALDRERERVRGHSRDHGRDFFEDKVMESRSERDDGEYEEEDVRQSDGRKGDDPGFRSSAKRLKVSTDTSSLSSLSTLTTLSSLT